MTSLAAKLADRYSRLPKAYRDTVWAGGAFGGVQALRVLNNLILSRLLAPELFGVMAIVNSVRNSVAVFSDLGTNQSIIRSPRGWEREFHDTAWTVAVVRGAFLTLFCVVIATPIANIYDVEILKLLMPAIAIGFLLSGMVSASKPLLLKQGSVKTVNLWEFAIALAATALQIGLALVWPSIWVFIIGALFSSISAVAIYRRLMPQVRDRFFFSWEAFKEIFGFGKWLLVSSILAVAALEADRIMLPTFIPLELLGVYAIMRNIASLPNAGINRVSGQILFPRVSNAANAKRKSLRSLIARHRFMLLGAAALFYAGLMAIADAIVLTLLDERYAVGRTFIPILFFQFWVSSVSAINQAKLMGVGKPSYMAVADGVKLVALIFAIPYAFSAGGFEAVVWSFVWCELLRYAILTVGLYRVRLGFALQDAAATALLAAAAGGFLQLRSLVGVPYAAFPWPF